MNSTTTTQTVTVDREKRTFRVVIPDGPEPKNAPPLLFAFCGGTSTGGAFERQSGLTRPATRQGYVVVYPEGVSNSWNAVTCCGPAQRQKVNDLGFVDAMLAYLTNALTIDPKRIYATGFSNGWMLAQSLAQHRAFLAAIGGVAGDVPEINITPARATPCFAISGTEDDHIPVAGGFGSDAIAKCYHHPVKDCVAYYERIGAEVSWQIVAGLGHQWPGGFTAPGLGPNVATPDATAAILDWFSAHTL